MKMLKLHCCVVETGLVKSDGLAHKGTQLHRGLSTNSEKGKLLNYYYLNI